MKHVALIETVKITSFVLEIFHPTCDFENGITEDMNYFGLMACDNLLLKTILLMCLYYA